LPKNPALIKVNRYCKKNGILKCETPNIRRIGHKEEKLDNILHEKDKELAGFK
jgi:hypothetical protein